MSYEDGTCDICKRQADAFSRFLDTPFVDGNNYEFVCWTCANVPRRYIITDEGFTKTASAFELNDVKDMLADGWSKDEAIISINAVKQLLKKAIILETNNLVLDTIYGIEVDLTDMQD